MFERRLKILLFIMFLPALAIAARLVQLQLVKHDYYCAEAEDLLYLEPVYLPCLRGEVTDRNGTLLAYNAPAWDITVHYGALADNERALLRMCRRLDIRYKDASPARIEESWRVIARISGEPVEDLEKHMGKIRRRVQRVKEWYKGYYGYDDVVKEETWFHPLVRDLSREQQIDARQSLAPYPWVKIEPSQVRRYAGGPSFGHILGFMNEVDEEAMDNDPLAKDRLAGYQLGDLQGVTGIEELGERFLPEQQCRWLRGHRGRIHVDRKDRPLNPPVDPENGHIMQLSLDAELQQRVYEIVGSAVQAHRPNCTGGAAVLIHIPTRQVLAMVSYPAFDPDMPYGERLKWFRTKPFGQPHVFRAVAGNYPPGSTVKPMILAAALAGGKVGPGEVIYCAGRLFPDQPGKWRCLFSHGDVNPIEAVQRSCNVFFYTLGQRMGTELLTEWLGKFGFGRTSGTELREEQPRYLDLGTSRGLARLVAIGQGRLQVTPIQVANMMATIATGSYQPVQLWLNDPRPQPVPQSLDIRDSHWRIVRQAMHDVVYTVRGTAYRHLHIKDFDGLAVLGKTGSAETTKPGKPTHSWFSGYMTDKGNYLGSATLCDQSVAFTVVIEYSGHGGEVAAPAAEKILRAYLKLFWPNRLSTEPAEEDVSG